MKCIYVSGTEQHAGKTSTSLGLYAAARARGYDTCYFKPVGQRCIVTENQRVDEDAVVFKHAIQSNGHIKDLNPVSIPRGFTREYIFDRRPELTRGRIMEAFERLKDKHELAIVEGTGHAGVGSVLDVSNAQVAAMLDAPCLMVSPGGIGSSIDLVALNRAVFEREGVEICGVIVNKVYEEKYDHVAPAVRQGLKNLGLRCLGVVPYRRQMTYTTVEQVRSELHLPALCNQDRLKNRIRKVTVAAVPPEHTIEEVEDGSLVVFPGDREEGIVPSVKAYLRGSRGEGPHISGIMLADGYEPHGYIEHLLERSGIPVLTTGGNSIDMAMKARSLIAKIWEQDTDKITLAQQLINDWVELDELFRLVGMQPAEPHNRPLA